MNVKDSSRTVASAQRPDRYPAEQELGFRRRYPVGAEVVPGGGTHFRVWAPSSSFVQVHLQDPGQSDHGEEVRLEAEGNGCFSGYVAHAQPGMLYRFHLENGLYPDPASRFQPEGPHGPSQIVDASQFKWTDQNWRGI